MTRFLLIRHGETDMVGRRLSGRMPGVPLNRTGREQAQLLTERLRGVEIAAVYASPLERAQETAAPLAQSRGLTVRVSPELAELDYGEWTGRSFHELEQNAEWRRFNAYRSGVRVPGGESMLEVQVRAVKELSRLSAMHQGETVAVVSHAEWIRSAVMHCLGMPLDLFGRIAVEPRSVTTVDWAEWGPVLQGLNAL